MDYRQTYTLPDAVFGDAWLPEIRLHTTNETLLQTDLERLVIEWSKATTTGTTFSMDSDGADPCTQFTHLHGHTNHQLLSRRNSHKC